MLNSYLWLVATTLGQCRYTFPSSQKILLGITDMEYYWKGKKEIFKKQQKQNLENSLSLECKLHEQLFVLLLERGSMVLSCYVCTLTRKWSIQLGMCTDSNYQSENRGNKGKQWIWGKQENNNYSGKYENSFLLGDHVKSANVMLWSIGVIA